MGGGKGRPRAHRAALYRQNEVKYQSQEQLHYLVTEALISLQ